MKIGKRYGVDHFRKLLSDPATAHEDLSLAEGEGLIAVCAGVPIEKADEGHERRRTFTISTGVVDRHGDTIAPKGWELENFRAGGAVLFGHSSFHPIGKPVKTWVARGPTALKSTADFAETPFAAEMFGLIEAGILRSSSVGFRPKEWEVNTKRAEEGEWMFPLDFKRQELLEWSVVPVPANPEALVEAAAKGCELAHWKAWAEQALDGEGGPHIDLVVPRDALEASRKAAGGVTVYSVPTPPQAPVSETPVAAAVTERTWEPEDFNEPAEPGVIELAEELAQSRDAYDAQATKLSDALEGLVCEAVSALTDALALVAEANDKHRIALSADSLAALRDAHQQIASALPAKPAADKATQELDLENLDEAAIRSIGSLAASVASAAVDQALGRVPD